jgi:hypothetical protein
MTVSVPFQQQFTWRKLGYLFFTDSLDYRQVLEQNPQWNVTQLPPIGAQIRIRETSSSTGGLVQGSFLFGQPIDDTKFEIYPFDSVEDYVKSLVKYSPSAVQQRDKVNGYSLDSEITTVGG